MMTETKKPDGRRLRRVRNRAAIVGALLDIVQETGECPTANEIAMRAHVSQSSVFRLFGDKNALLREGNAYVYDQLLERFPFPDLASVPPSERAGRLVDHLARVHEFITPIRRIFAREGLDPSLVRSERARTSAMYLKLVGDAIPGLGGLADSSKPALREGMRLLTSWDSWNYLRSERGLSVSDAKEVLTESLGAVLDRHGMEDPD